MKFKIQLDFTPIIREIKKFINWKKNNLYKVNLKNLTQGEIEIIKKFYNDSLQEYILSSVSLVENEHSFPIILKLVERKILNALNDYERMEKYDGRGVHYTLTDNARKKLNKKGNKLW